jgi:hypothetical protein
MNIKSYYTENENKNYDKADNTALLCGSTVYSHLRLINVAYF